MIAEGNTQDHHETIERTALTDSAGPLAGGFDRGAMRRGDRVQRVAGPWSPAVHHLLGYLTARGFTGAPQPMSLRLTSDGGEEQLTFLPGETVGDQRPWPAWVHSQHALEQTARWLTAYHRVVADYLPPADAAWRESHAEPGPGVIVAHNDAAPYNAVWGEAGPSDRFHHWPGMGTSGLIGFIDWDMAGPRLRNDDLAWTAFSWVPLHARHVVATEGFTDFDSRRARLTGFLHAYGSELSETQILHRLHGLIEGQIELMHDRANGGDETYHRMIDAGRADDLAAALQDLAHV